MTAQAESQHLRPTSAQEYLSRQILKERRVLKKCLRNMETLAAAGALPVKPFIVESDLNFFSLRSGQHKEVKSNYLLFLWRLERFPGRADFRERHQKAVHVEVRPAIPPRKVQLVSGLTLSPGRSARGPTPFFLHMKRKHAN